MITKKLTVPFNGTKEQEEELFAEIKKMECRKDTLIPILQKAQEIYGYLPLEVQETIAEKLNISSSIIYGVVTFYAQFSTTPKAKYNISVCLGTACYVKGAGNILERIESILQISEGETTADGKFSIEECRCIGACGLAPIMKINDDVYGRLMPDNIKEIISKY